MTKCVRVHALDVPYHADCEYEYYVSEELYNEISVGSLVVVPFGIANREKVAVVVGFSGDIEYETNKIKHISSVMSSYLALDEEMLGLCRFMKSNTLCTVGEAVKCMVPSTIISKVDELLTVTEKPYYGEEYMEVYSYIARYPGVTLKRVNEKFPDKRAGALWLIRNKYVTKKVRIKEADRNKYESVISLSVSREDALDILNLKSKIKLRSQRHKAILSLLLENGDIPIKDIYKETGADRTQIDALIKKCLIKEEKNIVIRDPYAPSKIANRDKLVLSKEQREAYNEIESLYSTGEARAVLLHGVTGSGKTSVIKEMIDRVISDKRSVIILVPEISLNTQTVSTFCGYYGDRVAVIHSGLSSGERFDAYKRIKDGECDIVIGTRSAVFAPLSNLGMIVIDEEQEHTYKSDTNPKYLAHDIARYRCRDKRALMLLASATPSLTSYYKAVGGIYTLVKMTKRYGNATLPEVIITDMHKEKGVGNTSVFSTRLASMLAKGKEEDKQAILFLNRRGYHSSISCTECGKVIECPNCSVAMTYHSYKRIEEDITADNAYEIMSGSGVLRCHYCGYQTRVPRLCSSCNNEHFEYVGFGTQKLERDIAELLPGVSTIRMDADTTTQKTSYERILGAFLNKEADVLIGTQMVTKGHNFPSVTLVGVMLADMMLYTGDYRASERTFSMLTQVIGRAGRAKDKGIAVIQTNSPSDRTIQFASTQDYEEFYKNEIQIRKSYLFPPFCDIVLITVSSTDEREMNRISDGILNTIRNKFTELNAPCMAYGPFEAPVYRYQGRYRKRIIVKCKLTSAVRTIFAEMYGDKSKYTQRTGISIDFNPNNL